MRTRLRPAAAHPCAVSASLISVFFAQLQFLPRKKCFRGMGAHMVDDPKQCEDCAWPIDCCTQDDAPKVKSVAVDCPKDHQLWERRLSEARLSLISGVSMTELAALEKEDLVEV